VCASRAGTGAFGPVSCASGRHMDVGAGESDHWRSAEEVERGDTWTEICDRMLRVLRLIGVSYASGHHVKVGSGKPTTLFRWGLYISPMAGSCSLSWSFSLT
jgi:hypothetical protein